MRTGGRAGLKVGAWATAGAIVLVGAAGWAEARSGQPAEPDRGVTAAAAKERSDQRGERGDRRGERGKRRDAGRRHRGAGRHRLGHLARRAVHGEVTVRTKDGFQQVAFQKGEVTAVTAISITVKSADGFTATYQVNDETKVRRDRERSSITAVRAGDRALVVGVKEGAVVRARAVLARSPGERAAGADEADPADFDAASLLELAA